MLMMMGRIKQEAGEFRDGLVPVKPLGAVCWTSFYRIPRNPNLFTSHFGNVFLLVMIMMAWVNEHYPVKTLERWMNTS